VVTAKPAKLSKIFLSASFLGTYIYLLFFFLNHTSTVTAPSNSNLTIETSHTVNSTEKVTRVIDGDTIEIEGGIKVRLIGIDTPEMKNKNRTIDCFATEAKQKVESLLNGKEVVLVKDVSETDKYGRLLRYVYLGDEMINDTLVKEGYAKISTFPPDVKFKDQFITSGRQAREAQVGLWQACK